MKTRFLQLCIIGIVGIVFVFLSACKIFSVIGSISDAAESPFRLYVAILGILEMIIGIGLIFRFHLARYIMIVFSLCSAVGWSYNFISEGAWRIYGVWNPLYFVGLPVFYLIFFNLKSVKKLFR